MPADADLRAVRFAKYHGTGNDFVLVDGRSAVSAGASGRLPLPEDQKLVQTLCRRHFGIGADGLIVLEAPSAEGPPVDFHMRYHNADGRPASFCGNGARCAVAFARQLGWIDERARFTAADGVHEARVLRAGPDGAEVALHMADTGLPRPEGEDAFLDTGSPHWLRFVAGSPEALLERDLLTEARALRYAPRWAADGVNVNLVLEGPDGLWIRTYERGVEDETLSCGTGVTAAALAWAWRRGLEGAGEALLRTRGGRLRVAFRRTGEGFRDVVLTGPARRVFDGTWTGAWPAGEAYSGPESGFPDADGGASADGIA